MKKKREDRQKERREIRKKDWRYRNVALSEGRGSVRYSCRPVNALVTEFGFGACLG
jgi:hypothetical protein